MLTEGRSKRWEKPNFKFVLRPRGDGFISGWNVAWKAFIHVQTTSAWAGINKKQAMNCTAGWVRAWRESIASLSGIMLLKGWRGCGCACEHAHSVQVWKPAGNRHARARPSTQLQWNQRSSSLTAASAQICASPFTSPCFLGVEIEGGVAATELPFTADLRWNEIWFGSMPVRFLSFFIR